MILQQINDFFYDQYYYSPIQINRGHCCHWAMIAVHTFGGELCMTEGHAFIEKGKNFFDSESVNGVDDWQSLPCVAKSIRKTGCYGFDSPRKKYFIEYWDEKGRYGWCQNVVDKGIKYLKSKTR